MSLIWSVIPTDLIFDGARNDDMQTAAWYSVGGVVMSLADAGQGMAKIERIVSSNPADYMRMEWQPGQLIPFAQSRKV